MFKNNLLFSLICIFSVFKSNCQELSLAVISGLRWPQSEFYLNYQAVENDELRVIYPDGEEAVIEKYSFQPLWMVGALFSYAVKNPRKRGRSLIYTFGLGHSQTSLLIDQPRRVIQLSDPPSFLISGAARQKEYAMGYLTIPIGVERQFQKVRQAFYWSLGIEVENNILLYKKTTTAIEGGEPYPSDDSRSAAIRNYWVAFHLQPKAGFVIADNWDIFVSASGGVSLLNLMSYDQFLFNQSNISFGEVEAFDRTKSFNLSGGFRLGVAYSF